MSSMNSPYWPGPRKLYWCFVFHGSYALCVLRWTQRLTA